MFEFVGSVNFPLHSIPVHSMQFNSIHTQYSDTPTLARICSPARDALLPSLAYTDVIDVSIEGDTNPKHPSCNKRIEFKLLPIHCNYTDRVNVLACVNVVRSY